MPGETGIVEGDSGLNLSGVTAWPTQEDDKDSDVILLLGRCQPQSQVQGVPWASRTKPWARAVYLLGLLGS